MHNRDWPEYLFNGLFLVANILLLSFDRESFFRILLLMPIVASALSYGVREGYIWAFFASMGLVVLNIINKDQNVDVDILAISSYWLFAWLLGKMTEAEFENREELQKQAAVDGLTGVFNHRVFYSLLDEYFLKAKVAAKNMTIIMIDIDFFKYYNDAYGHQKGDRVLNQVAQLIEEEAGDEGICARYGGDEFAVILPNASSSAGMEMGEKVRAAVEAASFEGMNILPKGRLTVSIGVASYPEHAASKEQLIQKADEALYRAKDIKTNKVELYYSVFDEIEKNLQDKEKNLLSSLRTLLMVVNAKDRYTYGHSERVMNYAVQIGRKLALWEWEVQDLMVGALLHDIGKIEVSREVLNKGGKLTREEWEAIRMHPSWGADMIRPISSLVGAVNIILYHHENYNGSGYPFGLKGRDIPLGARILRLADSFDAMTTNRPYKNAVAVRDVIHELQELKGIFYDPDVVDCFVGYMQEIGLYYEEVF
jgi:diguanylate cyclase (GGDEF)-like protein